MTLAIRWTTRLALVCLAAVSTISCSRAIAPLVVPGRSAVALTSGPNTSMIYLARTRDGVIAIDLGWWGQEPALGRALQSLAAAPSDVRHVFLTHSHRDHIGAWPRFRHARFHIASDERSRLHGGTPHRGWITRLAERIRPSRLPRESDIALSPFSSDTSFVIGTDTLRAFVVAGHTPGSVVYLFRGVLFVGDAVTYSWWKGFAPAKRGFSDDHALAARSLTDLWRRLPADHVRYLCTAHAHCAPYTPELVNEVTR